MNGFAQKMNNNQKEQSHSLKKNQRMTFLLYRKLRPGFKFLIQ